MEELILNPRVLSICVTWKMITFLSNPGSRRFEAGGDTALPIALVMLRAESISVTCDLVSIL